MLGQHGPLPLDDGLVETVHVDGLRVGGGDMHGDLAAEALERLGIARRLKRHDDADLAEPRRHHVVHVACDRALLDLEKSGAPERHVLADGADHLLDGVGNGRVAAGKFGLGELVEIAFRSERCLGNA